MIVDIPNEIKSRITMRDVCDRYGIPVNESGFACCPLHGEKTPSMKIYPGRRGYCCFGCGAAGDVIDFARKYFDLPFRDAMRRLNDDFCLHIQFDDKPSSQNEEAVRQMRERQRREEALRKQKEQIEADYWLAFDEWKRLSDNQNKYHPQLFDTSLHPLFLEAIEKLPQAELELELAESRRRQFDAAYNKRNSGVYQSGLSQHDKAV